MENNYQNTQQTEGFTSQQMQIPAEYKPISMWGYFGYELLFSIPLVGLIVALVFSFGGTQNINLRNFARSYFCLLIIVAAVGGTLVVSLAGAGVFELLTHH